MAEDDFIWGIATSTAAVGSAALAKRLLTTQWEKRRGTTPGNPLSPDTTWGEAIAWALVSGAVLGVVRLVAQRSIALALTKRASTAVAGPTGG